MTDEKRTTGRKQLDRFYNWGKGKKKQLGNTLQTGKELKQELEKDFRDMGQKQIDKIQDAGDEAILKVLEKYLKPNAFKKGGKRRRTKKRKKKRKKKTKKKTKKRVKRRKGTRRKSRGRRR